MSVNETIGNAAAMREEVAGIRNTANSALTALSLGNDTASFLWDIISKCEAVLAAPPRNCDRFADELDAQLAFLNEVWLISIDRETMTEQDAYENWTDEMRARYGRWLLAPATEQKGEMK